MSLSVATTRNFLQRLVVALSLSAACSFSYADPVSFSGSVADPDNPALVGSGPGPSAPSFDDQSAIANNVAVYELTVPFGGFTDFNFGGFSDFTFAPFSLSFAAPAAGLSPYLSVFQGEGASALFFASSAQDTDHNGDFRVFLTAGTYMLTISNLTNQSIAELQGGTLGLGFTGRGDPSLVGSGSYQLTATVPEPDSAWLAAIGVTALLLGHRQRRRRAVASVRDAA